MTLTTFSLQSDIRGDQLADEIQQATGLDVQNRYAFLPPDTVRIAGDDVAAQQVAIQSVIDAHTPDPLYFSADVERAQGRTAQDQAKLMLSGVAALSPLDAGFVIVARSYAIADSYALDSSTVQTITDRASAQNYIIGTGWWGAMTQAQRQMKAIDLEAEAVRMALLVAVLR